MSNTAVVVPQCTHIKTNGEVCGSPAVSGTDLCYHHSAVKTTLAKARPNGRVPEEGFAPIPFLFPEDRASMQINFFLLLQAFNEQRIDHRTYRLMLSMLKAMAKNLGKTGSLVETSDQRSADSDQKDRAQGSGRRAQGGDHANTEQENENRGPASDGPFEFSPELMAELEEIEKLDTNDPSYAGRIRAAIADGANELRARGFDPMEIQPVAGSPIR